MVAPAWMAASQTLTRNRGRCGWRPRGRTRFVAVGAGESDHLGDLVEGLGAGDLELGGEMQVGGGEEGVDAAAGGGLDGACGGLDVFTLGAGERGDDRARPPTSRAMLRMDSESPSEAMAKPASRISTPRAAIWWAMRSFSLPCMAHPGDCSPSRRVVSKKMMRSGCGADNMGDLGICHGHGFDLGSLGIRITQAYSVSHMYYYF